jgi:multidrug efflux pump subunit AcrA (membrane-fusion protein)
LGTTVTIQIADEHPSLPDDLQVPIASLFDAGKGPGVWVVNGEQATISWRQVVVQRLEEDSARITGELKRGELIVALGAHLLHEDDLVRVARQDSVAATGSINR